MTDKPQLHPQRDELIAFGLGKLFPEEATKVESHLEECESCCETLLDLKDDTFVELVRNSPEPQPVRSRNEQVETEGTQHVTDEVIPAESTEPATPDDKSSHAATMLVPSGAAVDLTDLPAELQHHPRYEVIEQIGQGGMGAVYRAQHRLMNRPVAVKLINSQLIRHPQAVERFRREVQAAAQLAHPNIVAAYDAEQAGDVHFLAMEFVEGTDLSDVVLHRGPLPVAEACEYVRQAALGLQHAHEKGMVHRDIKPHNLMLSPDGQVRILDFGLAGFATEEAYLESEEAPESNDDTTPIHLTTIGSVMGTPDYIAPEQARDAHSADIRADIYSLGCTLHFLLSGKPVFEADSVVDKLKAHASADLPQLVDSRVDASPELQDILDRMLAKNADDRFQTPAAVAEALGAFLEPQTSPTMASDQPPAKRKTARALLATLITLLAGVIIVVTTQGNFEVRSELDGVQVTVSRNGETFRVLDVNSGTSVFWLPSEEFQVTARGNVDVSVSQQNVQVTWMGKQAIQITRTPIASAPEVSDFARIQGVWSAESITRGGQLPRNEQNPMVRTEFDGNKVTVVNAAGVASEGTFRLDTEQNPKQLRLQVTGQSGELRCIYKLEGNRLTLCMNQDPRGSIPTEFASRAGSKIDLIVLRRGPRTGLPGNEITLMKTLDGHYRAGSGAPISLSKDGTVLATCGQRGARIWNLPSGKLVTQLPQQKASISNVALSLDGKMAATSELNINEVFLWELPAGRLIGRLPTDLSRVVRLAFSPDGQWLAASGSGGVDVLDVESKKAVNQYRAEAHFTAFCFTPDGKSLVLGPNRIQWEIASGNTEQLVSSDAGLTAVQVTDDGQTLAGANGRSNQILLWDLQSGRQLASLVGHEARVWSLRFLPGERFLISGSEDGSIRIWDWQAGKEVARRDSLKHLANHVLPLPDGRTAVSFGHWYQGSEPDPDTSDWRVHVWRLPENLTQPVAGLSDHDRLQGRWVPVSGHMKLKAMTAEQLTHMSVTFDGDRVTLTDPDSGQSIPSGTFTIDADRDPKHITMTAPDKSETLPGIFQFDGDRLRLAWVDEDYARPTDFSPSDTADHMTAVFKRVPGSVTEAARQDKPATALVLDETQREVVKAVEAYLAVMDAGRFGALGDMLSSWAKQQATRGQISQTYQKLRDTFGKAERRMLSRVQLYDEFPGLPKGRYAGVQYKTDCARQKGLWESALLNVDTDGKWRMNTYALTLEAMPFPESERKNGDATAQKNQAAQTAAQAWLGLVDAGKYGESWEACAEQTRKADDKQTLVTAYTRLFQSTGELKSRAMLSIIYAKEGDGEFVNMQFDTRFARTRVTETVAMIREKDGQWRVSGYFHTLGLPHQHRQRNRSRNADRES